MNLRKAAYRHLLRAAAAATRRTSVELRGARDPEWDAVLRDIGLTMDDGPPAAVIFSPDPAGNLTGDATEVIRRLPAGGLMLIEAGSAADALVPLLKRAGFQGIWIKRTWDPGQVPLDRHILGDPRLRSASTSGPLIHDLRGRHEGRWSAVIGWKPGAAATEATGITGSMAPALHWSAILLSSSGYAALIRPIIEALDDAGIAQSVLAVGPQVEARTFFAGDPPRAARWTRLTTGPILPAPCLMATPPCQPDGVDHMELLRLMNPRAPAHIGLSMFETDRLPRGWRESLNQLDEIWVPSQFSHQVFAASGVDARRLRTVPFGVSPLYLQEGDTGARAIPNRRAFAFLSVFQWSRRKGADILLDAYTRSFGPKDDVCLILRSHAMGRGTLRQRVLAELQRLGRSPAQSPLILLLEEHIPDAEMPSLYRAADAFVLPTRGESLGLPFMEAMALGLPVIGTRWSAPTEFMTETNSYLLENRGLVPVDAAMTAQNPLYTSDQRWASPSVDHLVHLMRHVASHPTEARERGSRARLDIRQGWTYERTLPWILERASRF